MFWAVFLVSMAPTIFAIIVKDSPACDEYKYSYEIEDPITGDSKSLEKAVTGCYSVLDYDDGTRRIVHYIAGPYMGFKAVLVQEPAYLPYNNLQVYTNFGEQLSGHYSLLRTSYANPYSQPQFHSKPHRPNKYFTPADEISSKREPINGLYFEPNKNYV